MLTLFGWFLGLLAIGLPVALVLGGTAIVYMTTVADLPLRIVPQRLFAGLDRFILMSIPFFVLAGFLMNEAQLTDRLIRFANRVPLLYQQSACAITKAVVATNWRSYGLTQPRGALPIGPLVIMVHIASVWVPFTSESKEAIAGYPEILKELRLGLQDCGRKLGTHIRKGRKLASEFKKRNYIETYIPIIGQALKEILELTDQQTTTTVNRLTTVLQKSRKL